MSDLKFIVDNLGDDVIEKFRGKTILITGSNGFLGRWFSDVLNHMNENVLNNSCTIICADNNIVRDDKRPDSIVLNICNKIYPAMIGVDELDYIINCAGIASPKIYKNYPVETLDVSYMGTKNILELGEEMNVKSILCFSSSEVYGTPDKDNIPTTENYTGIIPTMSERSCYDVGKEVLETLSYVYHKKYGSPVKVVRPFNLYGPKMGVNDNRVFPNFIGNALIDEISLEIGGQIIDKHTGEYLQIMHDIADSDTTKLFMIGQKPRLQNPSETIKPSTLYIPLQFWFNKDNKRSLPLVALQYQEINIRIRLKPLMDLYTINDVDEMPGDNGLSYRMRPNKNVLHHELWRFLQMDKLYGNIN